MRQSNILARTWNGNESGLLWERLYGRDGDGYFAKLVCSGVFDGPKRFTDEAAMWAEFEADAAQFHGERV